MLGFRSLKYPATPDTHASDYDAQCTRYWKESHAWWDNWAANFIRCMMLLLAAFFAAIVLVIALG